MHHGDVRNTTNNIPLVRTKPKYLNQNYKLVVKPFAIRVVTSQYNGNMNVNKTEPITLIKTIFTL